jgi:hypothetical protein
MMLALLVVKDIFVEAMLANLSHRHDGICSMRFTREPMFGGGRF